LINPKIENRISDFRFRIFSGGKLNRNGTIIVASPCDTVLKNKKGGNYG
jgi:hypothetical protein